MDGSTQGNDDLAERVRAALCDRDLQAFGALLSDEVRWGSDGHPRACRNRTDVLATFSRLMNEGSSIGDLFHLMVGYAERPTTLQAVAWIVYVGGAVTAFVTMGRRSRRQNATVGGGSAPLAGPRRQPEASAPY